MFFEMREALQLQREGLGYLDVDVFGVVLLVLWRGRVLFLRRIHLSLYVDESDLVSRTRR